jgi:hypothetical protein
LRFGQPLSPRSHTTCEPRHDLGARPRLAAILGVRITDLKTAGELTLSFQSQASRGVKPRQIATFGLEHQFVIHLVSPCNVDGDIINMRAGLIDHIGQEKFFF